MELRQLQYFIATAELLNFTKASKQLFISQSALSQQIADLEKQLGVQLLARNRHTVRLTAVGTVFLKEAREAIARVEEAIRTTRQAASGDFGTLVIDFVGSFEKIFLPEQIRNFRRLYPNIKIKVNRINWQDLDQVLARSQTDIIFTLPFDPEAFPAWDYKVFYQDQLVVVVPADHPLATKSSVTLDIIKNEHLLNIPREIAPKGFHLVMKMCHDNGVTPSTMEYHSTVDSLLFAIESGSGIAILARSGVEGSGFGNLRCLEIEDADTRIDVLVAWKKNLTNPAVTLFLESSNLKFLPSPSFCGS